MNKESNKFWKRKSPLLKQGGHIKHSRHICQVAIIHFFFQVTLKVQRQHLDLWLLVSSNPLFSNFILLSCYRTPEKPSSTCVNQGQFDFNYDSKKFQYKCSFPWTGDSCQKKIGKLSSPFIASINVSQAM